jgi:hypothetical protein
MAGLVRKPANIALIARILDVVVMTEDVQHGVVDRIVGQRGALLLRRAWPSWMFPRIAQPDWAAR